MPSYLSADDLGTSLALRGLSDPAQGEHALQLVLDAVTVSLTWTWGVSAMMVRSNPLVTVEDNYDRLDFETSAVTRDQ